MMNYILETIVISGLLFLVYFLFLRKGLHFKYNRAFILIASFVALILPLITISIFLPSNFVLEQSYLIPIQDLSAPMESIYLTEADPDGGTSLPWYSILWITISSLLFIRFSIGLIKLFLEITKKETLKTEGLTLVNSKLAKTPFSFFKFLFIPIHFPDYTEISESLLNHENAHARLKHSIDIVWFEILKCVFWFNPFFFLMKRELEIVHEYQADEMAYSKSFYNSTYVESLISISSNNRPHLFSSPFSYNQLKNRIIMMNKIKANKPMRLTKIALSLSLSVVIISAFSFQLIEHPTNKEYPTIITTSKDHVPSIIPIPRKYKPELRSGYGHRIEPIYKTKKMHKGVDFVAPKGSSIISTANGTVEEVGNNEGYGIHVKIKHGKTYETFYAHMSKALVKKGETLKQGDEIGIIGTTGRSTGIHLHYEVLENGENVDPALFLPVQKKN